jgi:hypothetical protein
MSSARTRYRAHESKIQEEEVRRAVLSYAVSSGVKLRAFPNVIKREGITAFREWDDSTTAVRNFVPD